MQPLQTLNMPTETGQNQHVLNILSAQEPFKRVLTLLFFTRHRSSHTFASSPQE